jgi:hypothetical protein
MQKYYFFQEQQFFALKNSRPAVIPIPDKEKLRQKKPCFPKSGDFPFHQG